MYDSGVRQRFLEYLDEAFATYLSPENLMSRIQRQYERLQPALPEYLDEIDLSRAEYDRFVKSFASAAAKRPRQVIRYCSTYLDLSKEERNRYFSRALAAIDAYSQAQ